ncbi:U-box domain-containing protein 9-like [Tasmannia lanceolata]|uniref:U-box domain-containing protein 9-like n=1 Tax=Tasmannia lanceolata TaxID=3420 RepID=UPI00406472D4
MAKSSSIESVDPSSVVKAMELKRELQRLMKVITEEEDCGIEIFDKASKTLIDLKDLKFKRSISQKFDSIPEHFLCPISSELMKDPVILATGQTYDRPFIQAWLNAGHRTCPRTLQVLSHSILTPNYLVRSMISQWCEKQGIELPAPIHESCEGGITQGERIHLDSLLEKIAFPSISEQKQAVKELRLLTKRMPSFRALLGETPDAIPQLLSLLSQTYLDRHPELKEDVVTTILNLSIYDNNKKIVAETPGAINLLIDALQNGTMETKSNSAAALFTLSALDSNKVKIGESGAMKPLIDLLEQGNSIAKKDAASAIFNLCIIHENKAIAAKDGAVRVILKTIMEQTLVDESLAILAMLSINQQALEEMSQCEAVPCLLSIIKDSTCGRNRENSSAILYSICVNDRTKLREVREEENANGTLSQLAMNGTSRARRKASGILERLKRTTHTA